MINLFNKKKSPQYFAEIDPNTNLVKRVIVSDLDFIKNNFNEKNWIETSYENKFRHIYAAIGYTYDKINDVFIEPQPYASWTLDENFDWQPPKPKPVIADKIILWNEELQEWRVMN